MATLTPLGLALKNETPDTIFALFSSSMGKDVSLRND